MIRTGVLPIRPYKSDDSLTMGSIKTTVRVAQPLGEIIPEIWVRTTEFKDLETDQWHEVPITAGVAGTSSVLLPRSAGPTGE